VADGQPIIIRELEGQRREVVLAGTDLPEQGLEVGGALRTVRTHYPGSRRASTQVLGTEESDLELQGLFRDDWAGFAGWALAQMGALRALYTGQRYCELAWGETLVRRGYVKRAVFVLHREAVVGYRLVFEVAEADEAEVVSPVEFETATPEDLSLALKALRFAVDHLDEAVAAVNTVQAAWGAYRRATS